MWICQESFLVTLNIWKISIFLSWISPPQKKTQTDLFFPSNKMFRAILHSNWCFCQQWWHTFCRWNQKYHKITKILSKNMYIMHHRLQIYKIASRVKSKHLVLLFFFLKVDTFTTLHNKNIWTLMCIWQIIFHLHDAWHRCLLRVQEIMVKF
jgi:hypothetical protein